MGFRSRTYTCTHTPSYGTQKAPFKIRLGFLGRLPFWNQDIFVKKKSFWKHFLKQNKV